MEGCFEEARMQNIHVNERMGLMGLRDEINNVDSPGYLDILFRRENYFYRFQGHDREEIISLTIRKLMDFGDNVDSQTDSIGEIGEVIDYAGGSLTTELIDSILNFLDRFNEHKNEHVVAKCYIKLLELRDLTHDQITRILNKGLSNGIFSDGKIGIVGAMTYPHPNMQSDNIRQIIDLTRLRGYEGLFFSTIKYIFENHGNLINNEIFDDICNYLSEYEEKSRSLTIIERILGGGYLQGERENRLKQIEGELFIDLIRSRSCDDYLVAKTKYIFENHGNLINDEIFDDICECLSEFDERDRSLSMIRRILGREYIQGERKNRLIQIEAEVEEKRLREIEERERLREIEQERERERKRKRERKNKKKSRIREGGRIGTMWVFF